MINVDSMMIQKWVILEAISHVKMRVVCLYENRNKSWNNNIGIILIQYEYRSKLSWNKTSCLALPIIAKGEKIKIRQFNFELTFSGLICKGIGLSQCSL